MDTNSIEIPADDRNFFIGDVVNIITGEHCSSINIFNTSLPKNLRHFCQDGRKTSVSNTEHSSSEKCSNLEVTGESRLSVFGNLAHSEMSGRRISDSREYSTSEKLDAATSFKTVHETIHLHDESLKPYYSESGISGAVLYGTHFVTDITYGGEVNLEFLQESKKLGDVKQLDGKVGAQCNMPGIQVGDGATAGLSAAGVSTTANMGTDNKQQFSLKTCGIAVPDNPEHPSTLTEAMTLSNKLTNEGKGQPVRYILTPLLQLPHFRNKTVSCREAEKAYQKFCSEKKRLYDLLQDAIRYKSSTNPEDIKKMSQFYEGLCDSFLDKLTTIIKQGDSTECDSAKLVEDIKSSTRSISEFMHICKEAIGKINMAREIHGLGGIYVGHGTCLNEEIRKYKYFDVECYVFHFTQQSKTLNPELWHEQMNVMLGKMKEKNEVAGFFAVDCDIHPRPEKSNCCVVQVVKGGYILEEDLLQKEKIKLSPLVRANLLTTKQKKPGKLIPFNIPCTKMQCDSTRTYEWTCETCFTTVKYDAESDNIVCKCGSTHVKHLKFKCRDQNHGNLFLYPQRAHYEGLLSSLKLNDHLNLLLVGEAGVGKSTLVNGLFAFLQHNCLDDADKNNWSPSMPASAQATNINDALGRTLGQFKTEKTQVYRIHIGSTTLRLIDTPGIGSPAGVEEDTKILQNVFATISHLDEIHGIVVMVKANDAGNKHKMLYCVNQLLSCFHKDAAKNCLFAFTHASPADFVPGDSYSILKLLLQDLKGIPKTKEFCFDLEAMVTTSESAKLENKAPSLMSDSLFKSLKEMKRMLQYIRWLEPHPIKLSVGFNFAREFLLEAAPLNQQRSPWTVEFQEKYAKKYAPVCALVIKNHSIASYGSFTEKYLDNLDANSSQFGDDKAKVATQHKVLKSEIEKYTSSPVAYVKATFCMHHLCKKIDKLVIAVQRGDVGEVLKDVGINSTSVQQAETMKYNEIL